MLCEQSVSTPLLPKHTNLPLSLLRAGHLGAVGTFYLFLWQLLGAGLGRALLGTERGPTEAWWSILILSLVVACPEPC